MKTYYEKALEYEGVPYKLGGMDKNGADCSGLVNAATGQTERVWHTGAGRPPGNWKKACVPCTSISDFMTMLEVGDLLLWHGHCAFYAGGERLFHARKPGTKVGFTGDLKTYWLREMWFPVVYRQIF